MVAAGTFRMREEAVNVTDFSGLEVDDDTETGRFSAREEVQYRDEEYEYEYEYFQL